MTWYLYLCGFLFGTNIIIDSIIFSCNLCNHPTLEITIIDSPLIYNVLHDTTYPNFYVMYMLYRERKQVEIVIHRLHTYCLFKNMVSIKHIH